MNRFTLQPDNFDLELTMTCGQTFCWNRLEGELYGEGPPGFYSFRDGKPVLVRETGDGAVEVETELSRLEVREMLGLDHCLESVFDGFPTTEHLERARDEFWGLRIVQDGFFQCLVSYLLSPQMQIPVIKRRVDRIAELYGEEVEFAGRELQKFPEPEDLEGVSERELRDLGAGYRAEYVAESVPVAAELDPEELAGMDMQEAREELKQLHGVGDKVADCVLLFSLGFHSATPLDTWAWRALDHAVPELGGDGYGETAEALRERYGERAGYAVEYLFHAARQGVIGGES